MKRLIVASTAFLLLSLSNNIFAANRFWIANSPSNWNNTANWSSTSGGAGGVSVPGSSDAVTFDNLGVGNCTIDAAVTISSLTISSSYSGIISQGSNVITVSSTASFSGGTFTGGSANISITGVFTLSGALFTSTSGSLEFKNNAAFTSGTFSHNNGTVKFNQGSGTQNLTGTSPTFYNLELASSSTRILDILSSGVITVSNTLSNSGSSPLTINTGSIDAKGDITIGNTSDRCGGTALITINGTGTQNINGAAGNDQGKLPKVTINKSSGTLNLLNVISIGNNFTYTAGTVNYGSSTIDFSGTFNITGSLGLNNIAFSPTSSGMTATIASGTTITANGNITLEGTGFININTGNIDVKGNMILTNTKLGSGGGTGLITFNGTIDQTISATSIATNNSLLPQIILNKPSGILYLSGNITLNSNFTLTAGTIDAGTSTIYVVNNSTFTGNFSLYNLTINASVTIIFTITSGNTLTVLNDLGITGTSPITINTGTLAVKGNIADLNSNTSGGGNGTILINGTGTQVITSTGNINEGRFPCVTINKVSGTLTFPSLITVMGSWTYTAGTLDVTTNSSTIVFANTLTITGSHTLYNVIFSGSNNWTFTITPGTTLTVNGTMSITGASNVTLTTGNINLNGNLTLTNTATGGGGTTVLTFTGTSAQAITSSLVINQSGLPAVTINKPSGTLTFPALITVRGNWTYTTGSMDVTTNNSTVIFAGTINIGGASHTLNHVTFSGSNNYTFTVLTGTVLTVTGTLSSIGTSNVFFNTTVQGDVGIQAQGDVSISNTSTTGGGTGLILINGTGSQTFTGSSAATQGLLPYLKIQKVSGTLTLSGIISVSRDWTYVSGTVSAGSSTIVFGGNNLAISSSGMSFYNVNINKNTSTLSSSLTVSNALSITGTAVLSPGSNTINLAGSWSNYATGGFTESTSTVNLNGAALQTITCPGGENFTNLTINNSSTGAQLINNATVATTLTLTSGNIDLNSNTLTLGLSVANNGTIVRTSGTIINTGSFVRWLKAITIASGAATGLFPVGTSTNYRPFYVSAPTTAPTTGGTFAVSYTDAATNSNVSIADGASTISIRKDLRWAVSTGNGLAGGTYNIQVQGTTYGLIGNVSDLRLSLSGSVLGTAGTNGGTISNPQINRTGLSLANLSNTFYMGSVDALGSTLPVTLASFTVDKVENQVNIKWETAAEVRNDYFTILRSRDAISWEVLENIKGNEVLVNHASYEYNDSKPYRGISYYRLKSTDLDGQKHFSHIRSVNNSNNPEVLVFPNPATDYIIISSYQTELFKVTLHNDKGQVIPISIMEADSVWKIDISFLPPGNYFVNIIHPDFREIKKVIIN